MNALQIFDAMRPLSRLPSSARRHRQPDIDTGMLPVITVKAALLVACLVLTGCLGMPDKVSPVTGFELQKYLGKWYEIARLDHSFERGLTRVSAEYSLRDDGGVAVINRGYSQQDAQWKQAEGKAYFVNGPDEGYLKVSFFGPFYGSYVIFELDREEYQYAFVSGPDLSYLWLLSRKPDLEAEIIDRFVSRAQQLGYDTGQLIFVEQE
jgi:apolipoprotein D and lipocalin family protein